MSEIGWPESADERRALEFLDFAELDANVLPGCGDRIGDFALEEELGRGAHGVVYRARQTSLDREIALKLTPVALDELAPGGPRRAQRESHVLASLRHPAIVSVHAAGTVNGLRYVAMDLVDGATLKDVIAGRVADLPKLGDPRWIAFALALLRRLADGLAAAHAQGIVHRDLKPANVLIDREGLPYLADFGLARADANGDATWTQGFVGTPRFASPEQLRGAPLDARSDVFAMGALAYELLTGAPAFTGGSDEELLRAVRSTDPRWPARSAPPREVCAVVERCLEKRPSDRYADAGELRDELDRLLRFEPVHAVPRGPVARAWRRALRSPAMTAAIAALVVATAGGAAAVRWARASHERAERAELERSAAELNKRLTELERSFVTGELESLLRELAPVLDTPEPPLRAVRMAADALADLGRVPEALAMYRRELAGDPLSSAALWATHAPLDAPLDDLPEPVSARDFAAQGLLLARRRDYEAAERSFDAALRLEPAHFYWLLADARLLQRTGRVTRAHALIDSRFAAELPSPIVAHELARLRIVLGLSRKASGELVRTLSKFGDEPLLLADRALALAAAEFYGAAASAALRAYELLPDDPFVISVRGATAAKNGREEFAISFLQDALARHADSADIAVALGTALLEAGRPAEAEDVARLASTLDARDGGDAAWRLLADVQRARGDAQGEVDSLSRLVSPHVGEFRWIERRIEHELRRGRDDVAEELWQRATDDAGGLSPLSRAGGERLYAAGRYAEALSVLAALHLRTRTGESALAYSESLWRLASEERDLRRLSVDVLLRAARSVAQRDGELWCKLAEYLAEVGTPQELELLARESQWIRDARFDGWRGVGLHRIGRDDEARRAFASAREIDADGSIALWGEAELLLDTSLPGSDDRRRGLELALQARDVELAHRLGELGVHDAESLLARIERAIERALEDELVPGAAACAEAKRP